MKNEAQARIIINQLLMEAGWRFFDNEVGKANILPENYMKITEQLSIPPTNAILTADLKYLNFAQKDH